MEVKSLVKFLAQDIAVKKKKKVVVALQMKTDSPKFSKFFFFVIFFSPFKHTSLFYKTNPY